jgi:hypothetical protein
MLWLLPRAFLVIIALCKFVKAAIQPICVYSMHSDDAVAVHDPHSRVQKGPLV